MLECDELDNYKFLEEEDDNTTTNSKSIITSAMKH